MPRNENFDALERIYTELDIETRYFFAEYEMRLAIPMIHSLTLKGHMDHTLENLIIHLRQAEAHDPKITEEFKLSYYDRFFGRATKHQIGEYFRIRNTPYKTIRKITGLSPNTIAKIRFEHPYYMPHFRHWTPSMLETWDTLVAKLNLFNESLAHTNGKKEKEIKEIKEIK